MKAFLFSLKYGIKNNPENLAVHCREFFQLKEGVRQKVLDKFFKNISKNTNIGEFFDNKDARYYDNGYEISYFNSYYFCKKIIDLNINNICYFDKFRLSFSKMDSLFDYVMKRLKKEKIRLNIDNILTYPNKLPDYLAESVKFMDYLTDIDSYNIKYIVLNENEREAQRRVIRKVIKNIENDKFDIKKFYLNKGVISDVLIRDIDFIIYMIKNDIDNISYLDDSILNSLTDKDKERLVKTMVESIEEKNVDIDKIFSYDYLSNYLSKDTGFLIYIIDRDVDNVKYVDFHNIISSNIKRIIDSLALKLVRENLDFDVNRYPFRKILMQNYMFMAYLIDKDRHNIKYMEITNPEEVKRLIDIYLNKYRKCKFELSDYLDESGCVKNIFVTNKYMLTYLAKNDNKIFKRIDFVTINDVDSVVEVIVKFMRSKSFIFDNEVFLRNGKYQIALSNSYLFMREAIYKNFNNLAYIDTSMIDEKILTKIINYACRTVYYIRGDDKRLTFDIDGYFKNSMIINNEYFLECLRSL